MADFGGFRYGIEKATKGKWKCAGYYDFDKYACQIYNKNFKESHKPVDIKTIDFNKLPDFELLCAGFPCQPFSLAGKRKGFKEKRGTLFDDIISIIKAKKPKIVFLENVKGLLSAQNGYAFARVISSLDELGYFVEWQVLNSKNFGVPQNRERVFIIGYFGKEPRQKVFPLTKSSKKINKRNAKIQVASALQSPGHSAGNYKGMNMIELTSNESQGGRVYSTDGLAKTLSDGGGQGAKTGLYAVGVALRQRDRHGKNEKREQQLEIRKDNVANSLTSVEKDSMVLENSQIRRLTPIECERLQGFPDNWTAKGLNENNKEVEIFDTQRYKTLGNAVTTNVIQAIVEKLMENLESDV